MKSSRISRVVRILTALQSGRGYTADDLANMFENGDSTLTGDEVSITLKTYITKRWY